MTGKSHHVGEQPTTQNQNNAMSNDPQDGQRHTDNPGAIGRNPADKPPAGDAQDEATVEEFGREGMGISAKE
jgi:hypothetical protein